MIGNPFRRNTQSRASHAGWRVPAQLMFSAFYDAEFDHIVVGVQLANGNHGPAVELTLWDAVAIQDMIGAAINDALAASDGTV